MTVTCKEVTLLNFILLYFALLHLPLSSLPFGRMTSTASHYFVEDFFSFPLYHFYSALYDGHLIIVNKHPAAIYTHMDKETVANGKLNYFTWSKQSTITKVKLTLILLYFQINVIQLSFRTLINIFIFAKHIPTIIHNWQCSHSDLVNFSVSKVNQLDKPTL